ncbi:similar to Saccharomyces cerevisiae YBR059C AKL1 Ser-Thr protein kinase, member (with Ark1p and Prk1p) of the Ark kinase family [Maudiozyma saulgeensis]|uniref:Similar to Saccharomyces cerevisiae YBR059C AKL1 Ser-Thr protein kinase, member (With Ark1p and Prk1p) of the Ark kinase family n=1 Tax=Maudiozyma saulgeensis TaxID=1789683 RepID=A0A1X7R518_9SACH|nr:similar to Saccharomyces cerevisiae YBR059C AKL1 Ser-Thr protein kinase, member (with Ark1p and Prk1p) of the Ark kinase family [Kazachstania saulgeensis]
MSQMPTQNEQTTQGNPGVTTKYQPGKLISVGTHQIEIINYIAEGGFAQIYSVKFVEYLNEFANDNEDPTALKPGDIACLKRVIVHDENGLNELRNEVDVMKKLKGAPNIIQYYDSNASRLHNNSTGFEILLLMELCPNGSLLDYMNQRLATKLSEKEVVKIMYDITLALSNMHYLIEPLLHRDIKIENVLVDSDNNFKLCDFGSTSKTFQIVTTHQDIAMLTQDIYVHTTPQYRSPEMIDLYRYLPVNEKSDIWALGVLLYKLLFFTTPFEMTGQFAILHSKYEIPQNKFCSKLNNLIIIMLAENPNLRPNIYQVLYQICSIMGVSVPIKDKYEAGPYNFENYTHFQSKIQNIQFQMFELEKKRTQNSGKLGNPENKLLNEMFISLFDMASKIALPDQNVPSPTITQLNNSIPTENKNSSSDQLTSPTPDSVGKNSSHSQDINSPDDSNTKGANISNDSHGTNGLQSRLKEMDLKDGISYYPSVGELNQYIDKEMNQANNGKSEDIANIRFPDINQNPIVVSPEILDAKTSASSNKLFKPVPQDSLVKEAMIQSENTTNTFNQHKSTNPFPAISDNFQSQQMNTTQYPNISNSTPINNQQQPQSYPRIQTPVENGNYTNSPENIENYVIQRGQLPHRKPSTNVPFNTNEQSMMNTSFIPSESPNTGNLEYARSNNPALYQRTYNQISSPVGEIITQISPSATHNQKRDQKPTTTSQTNNPKNQITQNPQGLSKEDFQKYQTTPAQPSRDSVYDELTPPKIPPHPRKKKEEDMPSSNVGNLRDPKTGKFKIEQVGVDVGTRHPHHHSQHGRSRRSSGHDNSGVRRTASMNNKPNVLLERPTTESIDIDLDKIKRKSLDIKMHKMGFSSDLKDQSIHENEVVGNHSSGRSELDTQRLSKRNVSNGNIPVAASNTEEIKKSITRARQSLDLDRARREVMMNNDNNKRRSLFSMFRQDKKL